MTADGNDLRVAGRDLGLKGRPLAAIDDEDIPPMHGDEDAPPDVEGAKDKGPTPRTPVEIVLEWKTSGGLVRIVTGIAALDALCRGGLPIPWRVLVVGAPSAGKTALIVWIAWCLARAGNVCVGFLAVDEDSEDITIRLAQIAGFTIAQAEAREPAVMDEIAQAFEGVRLRLYGSEHTIESAGDDLAKWASAEQCHAALFIDSIQTASSEASDAIKNRDPRAVIEANVRAVRAASTRHRMLVIATSEANRASYRNSKDAEDQNDLASGAESRAIEFGAQTLLVLRTPKGHPNVIHARIAKNRRALRGELWLGFDHERHELSEVEKPGDDSATEDDREDAKARAAKSRLDTDAMALLRVVAGNPGLGTRELRGLARTRLGWGNAKTEGACDRLRFGLNGSRLVNRGTPSKAKWCVESTEGSCTTD